MPYYGDALPYYYGGPFSNHSSLMTGTGRTMHSPLGSTRYAPHLTTISESPLSALRRYSPAATITTRPKRVIDTADIDVSTPRALTSTRNNDQRHRLRRDRPTIRIRSQALKDNPALREHYERHEKTVGELLVEKFLIKDKKTEAEGEPRTKLYTQVSLEDDTTKKQCDELHEALQKRITRRMTRRKSSADVQMDREQLERELLLAQAQADVLDTLVAQEQAEIEVETRMGTLIRKNLVRSVAPLPRSKHEIQGLSGDDEDDTRTKKLTKKVKKRKKTTEKPSPPSGSDLDAEHDLTRTKEFPEDNSNEIDERSTNNNSDVSFSGDEKTLKTCIEEDHNENSQETSLSPSKGLLFKVEASNSVGDFSTLWVNTNVAEENEKQKRMSQSIVEQFRDSVRLPAPKKTANKIAKNEKDVIIEEHQQIVVLPVKKPYVKDDTRNSVYLTLKTQKSTNSNGMAGTNETIDRIEAIDDKIDQSSSRTRTNRETIGKEISTTTVSMANTTTGITRQPRLNKVAKFRSKDTTESDVEVKSISELPGAGETKGKIGTNDVRLQKLSEVNDDRSYSIANESISESTNRDENVDETTASIEDRSKDQICGKGFTISKDEKKNLGVGKIRDTENKFKVDKSKSICSPVESANKEKNLAKDGTVKSFEQNAVEEKIGKPFKPTWNGVKDLQKNNSDSISDESKRLKQSVTSSLDSSGTRDNIANLVDVKDNEKEQLAEGTESSTARILSSITPCSNVAESLPNASTINLSHVENGLNDAVKILSEEFNAEGIKNLETKIIENIVANGDSSLSRKITGKFVDSRGELSKTVGVTSEDSKGDGLGNLRKVRDKYRNDVEQPAAIESPKIFLPTKKDVNLAKADNDNRSAAKLKKRTALGVDATKKDDKNVVEAAKLRKNRKILPFSSRNDSAKIVELSSASLDLEVEPGVDKIQTCSKESSVIATIDDVISSSLVDKSLNGTIRNGSDIVVGTKNTEDSLEKKVESAGTKSTELTNGLINANTETIIQLEELPRPDIKTVDLIEAKPVKSDEEIDFWGEIESRRIEAPSIKLAEKFVQPKKNLANEWVTDTAERESAISDSKPIDSKPETKSNLPLETGTGDETKTTVAAEKKSNKVKKKKKTNENGGCKKKEQEKASADTIFEHFKIPDAVDEESHQRATQLEQRSKKVGEKSSLSVSDEEIINESVDIDRFERNLSTIVEESLSPVSQDIPKKLEALDLVTSNIVKEENEAATKLDTTRNLPSPADDNEFANNTVEKNLSVDIQSSLDKPEVSSTSKYLLNSVSLRNTEVSVPTINIVEASSTPAEEGIAEGTPEERILEDETEESPGTPTNEKNGEAADEALKNISKWHGVADLSLDEPDRDIGPEVDRETKKKDSGKKKKAGSSKKTSRKNSVESNSTKSLSATQDSSKKKKLVRRKKSSTKIERDSEKRVDQRSESKVSNSSDTTLKPGGPNFSCSPKNSGRNSPKQRPLDLIKMFYTTPVLLLTATPRDLSKVRRAKVKKRKHSSRTASASSNSTGSTRSTQSTGTAESTGSTEHEDDTGQKRISSTRSNDSGFDGSPRLSNCDMACHRKCEKLTGNLCGLNQKLVAEALQSLKRAPSQSSDNQRNSDGSDHHASGRITPPATNLPRFKKYTVMDFNFLKVLGKGSFGKVLLAELRRTDCVYAVKCLKKDVVLEDDDVECTLIERKVLTLATRHPYLCHLFCTFQTDSHLFFVMEYLNGGDLMFHIQKSGRFPECRARFYAAEIWSGLNFLHKKGIVYRDLKLDNVLLDFEGHIRIADFGMCKLQIFLDRTADTFCGTPDYMAPEIIKGLKYNQSVDWWSFGVLLYEMLTGQSPFSGCDEDELFWSICNERPFIPRYLTQEAMDVLICLLEKDAGKRPAAHEIANHPFFHSLQWDRLERRQLEAPFKPALEHTLDTRYFDTAFTAERPRLTPVPEQILTSMDQTVFRGFSYTNPNATD